MRHDAGRTSLKLQAWRLTDYDLVLHTDTDVVFTESPAGMFTRAHADGLLFHAQRQWGGRGYWGISSHLMLLKPNDDIASVLAANSAEGHFVPYTLGEQEVVESVYTHTTLSQQHLAADLLDSSISELPHNRRRLGHVANTNALHSSRRHGTRSDRVKGMSANVASPTFPSPGNSRWMLPRHVHHGWLGIFAVKRILFAHTHPPPPHLQPRGAWSMPVVIYGLCQYWSIFYANRSILISANTDQCHY